MSGGARRAGRSAAHGRRVARRRRRRSRGRGGPEQDEVGTTHEGPDAGTGIDEALDDLAAHASRGSENENGRGHRATGTEPGRAAACRIHFASCASSNGWSSWMSR